MMKLMSYIMLNCRKATFLIAKKEEKQLSLLEQMQLAMHLSMCKFCKAFEKQSAFIAGSTKHLTAASELTPEDISRFKKALEK